MKALSLTQPYASLVALSEKGVETRSWKTRYRGVLAICASQGFGPGGKRQFAELCAMAPFDEALARNHFDADQVAAHCGLIVAVANLVSIMPTDSVECVNWLSRRRLEWAFGDYAPGRFAWLLQNVVRLRSPVPTRRNTKTGVVVGGSLGVFTLDDITAAAVFWQSRGHR